MFRIFKKPPIKNQLFLFQFSLKFILPGEYQHFLQLFGLFPLFFNLPTPLIWHAQLHIVHVLPCNFLACLPKLTSLTITHNKLESVEDMLELKDCKAITNLNLAHNRLHDASIVDLVFAQIPDLVSHIVSSGLVGTEGYAGNPLKVHWPPSNNLLLPPM